MKIMTTLEYNRLLWQIDSLEHTVKGLRRVCDDQEAALEKEWNKNQQLTEELRKLAAGGEAVRRQLNRDSRLEH